MSGYFVLSPFKPITPVTHIVENVLTNFNFSMSSLLELQEV